MFLSQTMESLTNTKHRNKINICQFTNPATSYYILKSSPIVAKTSMLHVIGFLDPPVKKDSANNLNVLLKNELFH